MAVPCVWRVLAGLRLNDEMICTKGSPKPPEDSLLGWRFATNRWWLTATVHCQSPAVSGG